MRLLFVHDHPFYEDDEGLIYSGGAFTKVMWNNYLVNFDTINVYSRKSFIEPKNKSISSIENVNFALTQNYSSIKSLMFNYKKVQLELKDLILNSDVILIRLPSVLGVIAGLIALKYNKKIWVEQVGNTKEALSNHGSLVGKLVAPILHQFNMKLAKSAHFISYVTEKKLQRDYPCSDNAIEVALSDVIIKKILTREEIEYKLRFQNSIFKIGVIGGFDARYKGYDVLLKAINSLPDNIKLNLELYFIGKGDSQWVIDLSKELNLFNNIKFIGPLKSGEEINNLLASLSLYIQPSLTEGMPRALLESMAMGCPCLGSNVGGIPDILDDKYIHQAGDYIKLSEQIKFYFDNRLELERESNSNIEKIKPYLFENLNKRRLGFYSEINKCINAN